MQQRNKSLANDEAKKQGSCLKLWENSGYLQIKTKTREKFTLRRWHQEVADRHSAGHLGQWIFHPRTIAQFTHNLAEKSRVLGDSTVTSPKPGLATFWYYAKVELVPPTPAEIPRAIQSLKEIVNSAQTGSFKQLTVKVTMG